MESLDVLLRVWVRSLKPEQLEWFEERCGILEFDASLPRGEAERQAAIQTADYFGLPAPPSV